VISTSASRRIPSPCWRCGWREHEWVVSGVGIVNALQMASAVLGALPLVFVFLLAQRQIVEGVAGTGLK
jgi:hypothetical protein